MLVRAAGAVPDLQRVPSAELGPVASKHRLELVLMSWVPLRPGSGRRRGSPRRSGARVRVGVSLQWLESLGCQDRPQQAPMPVGRARTLAQVYRRFGEVDAGQHRRCMSVSPLP
jgi:hypothetical protein